MNIISNRVQIERDNRIRTLENNIFDQIANIVKPEAPKVKKDTVMTVGVEEALKELLEIEKSQRDRTAG